MKDQLTFDNADEMADVLRTGVTLTDELGVCYDYIGGLLNPYRYEDNDSEGAITDWSMCDGETVFKLKDPGTSNVTKKE